MISIEHPYIRDAVADLGYGLLPVQYGETDKFALIVKAPKEAILTARMNQEIRLYLVPSQNGPSLSSGIITAFFDDHDEPLVLCTPMYAGDQLQLDICGVLDQEAFDMYFFDEHHREMMGVRVQVRDSELIRERLKKSDFNDLDMDRVGSHLGQMASWFSRRSVADDDAAFVLEFVDSLYPDDLVIMDVSPEAYDFHGAQARPALTSLERQEPGEFQERDIAGLLKRVFPATSIFLNPMRLDSGKEYADVLCVTDQIFLVVQAKDSPNTEASLKRGIERKKSVIRSHIGKASQQLRGAMSYAGSLGSEGLKIVVSDGKHSIGTQDRLIFGLVVVKELFDDDYRACSEPVLRVSAECKHPCALVDFSALHLMTLHAKTPVQLMNGLLQIFEVGIENGEFPKPRFLGPPAG